MYFLRLKRRGELPDRKRDTEAIFAAEDGTLKHMDPDGNVEDLAGAGSLPSPTSEGDVLTVVSGDWAGAAPSGGSLPFPNAVIPVGYLLIGNRESASGDWPLTGQGFEEGAVVALFGQTDTSTDGIYVGNSDGDLERHPDFPAGTVLPMGAIVTPANDVAFFMDSSYTSYGSVIPIRVNDGVTDVTIGTTPTQPSAFGPVGLNLVASLYSPVTGGTAESAALKLPTSDPLIAGALWNNAGTPAISNGP